MLRQIDRRLGLMKAVDVVIPDPRNPDYITHTQLSLLRQRVYGLGLGYEDLNDHKTLRNDPALQTAVDREQKLVSQSTLCRLDGRTGRKASGAMIPFAGITVVATATADDINDLCTDIQEARDSEQNLFGDTSSSSVEEEKYCHETMAEELASMADKARADIARDFGISYRELKKQAGDLIGSMKQSTDDIVNAPYQEAFEKQYINFVKYWSRKLEELSDDPVPKGPPLLEGTGKWWGGKAYEWIYGT